MQIGIKVKPSIRAKLKGVFCMGSALYNIALRFCWDLPPFPLVGTEQPYLKWKTAHPIGFFSFYVQIFSPGSVGCSLPRKRRKVSTPWAVLTPKAELRHRFLYWDVAHGSLVSYLV